MGQFSLVVSYADPQCIEEIEVHAEGLSEAKAMCERITADYENMLGRLESKNVFLSKRMCGCEALQKTTSNSFITTVT